MRLFILLSVLIFGCSTMQPVTCPPPTIITHYDTIHKLDTQYLYKYISHIDTFYEPVAAAIYSDSLFIGTWLYPSGGDDYPQIQATVNYAQQNQGHPIRLAPGTYILSHPIVVAKRNGSDYGQSWIDIEGPVNAKNTPASAVATFFPTFTNAPVICLQQCKGCVIKNIVFKGLYTLPTKLTQTQIDTLSYSQWSDGICTDGSTNPYTAIAIDPFSDSNVLNSVNAPMYPPLKSYYLPNMSRSGSTDVRVEDCAITGFVVGIVTTPSDQQNGDEIMINNDHIDYCRSVIAFTQAQSKECLVSNLMCWGGVHTVFDGINFGVHHGDGATAPMIDGANIAGIVNQLFDLTNVSFPFTARRIYAEGLFKIGSTVGAAGINFQDFQIDFQNSNPGCPSPDFYYFGGNTTWLGCMLRLYNNGKPNRIILNCSGNTFYGGSFSAPPFCGIIENILNGTPPIFNNVSLYYSGELLNNNQFDSSINFTATVHINSGFTGWYIRHGTESIGDLILSTSSKVQGPEIYATILYVVPVGFVSSISSDTVYLTNTGQHIYDGQQLSLIDTKVK